MARTEKTRSAPGERGLDDLPLVAQVDQRGEEPREQQDEGGQGAKGDGLGA
jgi:hypothetical protein